MNMKESQPLFSRSPVAGGRCFEKWGLGEDFQPVHSLTQLNKWNPESKSERKQKTHLKWVEKLLNLEAVYECIFINSCNWALLFPLHHWGNWGSGGVNELPKVIQRHVADTTPGPGLLDWSHITTVKGKPVKEKVCLSGELLSTLSVMIKSGSTACALAPAVSPRATHRDEDGAPSPQVCPSLLLNHQAGMHC